MGRFFLVSSNFVAYNKAMCNGLFPLKDARFPKGEMSLLSAHANAGLIYPIAPAEVSHLALQITQPCNKPCNKKKTVSNKRINTRIQIRFSTGTNSYETVPIIL